MSDDPDKVWPTGLTLKEAEEVHSYLIDGTRVFGAIALIAWLMSTDRRAINRRTVSIAFILQATIAAIIFYTSGGDKAL